MELAAKVLAVALVLGLAWLTSPGILVPEGVVLTYTAAQAPSQGQLEQDIDHACRRTRGVLRPLMKAPDTITLKVAQPDGTTRVAVLRCEDKSVINTSVR